MASAVIHIAKEVERTQLSSEASNTSVGGAGTASNEPPAGGEEGSVWITKIGSTEVGFVVGLAGGLKGDDKLGCVVNGGIDSVGRDSSLPFFVRVNGIVWPQTEIFPLARRANSIGEVNGDVVTAAASGEDEWTVEVTGLTGSTEYDFEFVKTGGGVVFYGTSACTLPAQGKIASAAPTAKHQQQPSRPLSPVTTLLHSLAQANSSLAETKGNLKSIRKAHKTALSEIRKEIEKHRGLIGNDRGEERAFRRNLALRESIKRAEEEAEQMSIQMKDLQNLPDKMKPEWEAKKKQWQAEKRRLSTAQAKAAEDKANADRQASAVESEVASLAAKKEKMMARLTKLRVDLGKLDSENSEGSDTKERRQAEREAAEMHRQAVESEYLGAIQRLEARINEYAVRSHENWGDYYAQNAALQQIAAEMPLPSSAHGSANIMLPFGMIPHDAHSTPNLHSSRERSMSIFSDGSVITNLSELGHTSSMSAFEPITNRHSSAFEYAPGPIGVIGRGRGGEM
ncbi:hypothetical protein BZA05DRAFT_336361 [Tricharina praecox]|uniref:uncharacterized protein n=1 Tax=Tricharina praecox TaxID=43433 RepID=UPI0022208744|nr:uncharacterized protein BZA05DRAFT_336361 [Tricharina praecox]KAI5853929.1 hypothetical protein BZA05DRAFT_336361 [Tricharina praecox]